MSHKKLSTLDKYFKTYKASDEILCVDHKRTPKMRNLHIAGKQAEQELF